MSSVTRRETTVNGNRTQLWSCDDSAPARRLSASLDRNDESVERIKSSTVADATVWVNDDAAFKPPEGWTVESVFNAPNGGTSVRLSEDA
jgi:hypothetical protein